MRRFSIFSVLALSVSLIFAMAAPVVAGAQRAFERYVTDPLGDYFAAPPAGLEFAELRSATTTVGPNRARVRSFASRRDARIVGSPALAFDLAVPRQGGLLAV